MKRKKNVLVGVCGGISAYKTCELVRLLRGSDYEVKVVMTPSALNFVSELTFQVLSLNPVYSRLFTTEEHDIQHVTLCGWADICVIAPASANTLSKIANGICDNLLLSVVSALPPKTPVVFAPAMNVNMWRNPLIQKNVERLKNIDQYHILNPTKGPLACGISDSGRMQEAKNIFAYLKEIRA